MIRFMSLLLIVLLSFNASAKKSRKRARANEPAIKLNKIATCKIAALAEGEKPSEKMVLVIKQWHLAPTTITKGFKEKYPQEKNQTAIYKNLSESVKNKKIDLVLAEGCQGEINEEFTTAFNGWTLDELQKQAQTKNYAKIISHVPLKLEARWGKQLTTLCGDSEALIQEGNLRMSNLRGWMGFWGRFSEAKPGEEEKVKLYADAAADLLGVPKTTPLPELKAKVQQRSKEELALFVKSLNDRNDSFVKTLTGHEFKTAAVVIGGLHAEDLKTKLEQAGLPCEVFEPPGYVKQDEDLIEEFQQALR